MGNKTTNNKIEATLWPKRFGDKINDTFIDEDFSSSDESDTNTDDREDLGENRRYPMKNWRQRTIEGSIPWDSINIVEHQIL